jgi:hypothetical protein
MSYPMPYSLARLQARIGGLPTAAEWTRLHSIEGFYAFLHAARRGPLRDCIVALDIGGGSHEIERRLRHEVWRQIEELTHWLPGAWHPALKWVGILPYLEIFAYLRRGGEIYPWMREDMKLFGYLRKSSNCEDMPSAFALSPPNWADGWQRNLPKGQRRERAALDTFSACLLAAAGAADAAGDSDDRKSHQRLQSALLRLFHGHCQTPLAAFAYLGLVLLQARLLRSELQRRLLFRAGYSAS